MSRIVKFFNFSNSLLDSIEDEMKLVVTVNKLIHSLLFSDFCSETDLFKDVKEELQKKKRRRRRSSICLAELKTPEVSAETRGR